MSSCACAAAAAASSRCCNAPLVYHLHHPERGKIRDEATLAWWAEQEASDRTRCELGYDSPFDSNT